MLTLTWFYFNEFTFNLTGDSYCFFKCSEINYFEKATSQRLLLLDHRSLIKNKTETAVINIVNLLHIPNGTHSLIASWYSKYISFARQLYRCYRICSSSSVDGFRRLVHQNAGFPPRDYHLPPQCLNCQLKQKQRRAGQSVPMVPKKGYNCPITFLRSVFNETKLLTTLDCEQSSFIPQSHARRAEKTMSSRLRRSPLTHALDLLWFKSKIRDCSQSMTASKLPDIKSRGIILKL